ncbi:redoxin family protein [Gilvimarinus sp. F26214L]|uniref:redoxin family protein n=1 Tax=Gilvimarinus sp. DZF01 TaxID=3461371 RepID=UPI0040465B0C
MLKAVCNLRPLLLLAVLTACSTWTLAGEYNAVLNIGDPMPEFSQLPTVSGDEISSSDIDEDVVVLISLSNTCPFSRGLEKDLLKLVNDNADKPVKVVGMSFNINHLDKMPAMQERAKEQGFNFTYLRDDSQELGRALGTSVTPEFFVFNKDRKLIYMGLLHNSPAMENGPNESVYLRGEPQDFYVQDAIDHALAGTENQIKVRETSAYGCTVEYVQ